MQQPFQSKTMIRILVVVIVFLSLVAGYYHSQASLAERKLDKLQQRMNSQIQEKQ